MRYSVRKRDITLLAVALTLLALYILLNRYYHLRDSYYKDYLRHKEIMLLLKNYQERKREEPSESLIRDLTSQSGGTLISIRQTDLGYEVKVRSLSGKNLPQFIHSIESRGIKVIKLKAVDNTGEGLFDLEVVIR